MSSGYYIHHQGRGHLSRALAIAAASTEPITGLSSLPRPAEWQGPWIELPRDDDPPADVAVDEVDADERLHWVPLGHPGLRGRMARISAWIEAEAPRVLVADVSVEVALLARLHGVPVISVVLPGRRDDPAHALGYAVSSALLAAWPPEASGMIEGLDPAATARLTPVGAISRFAPVDPRAPVIPSPPGAAGESGAGDGGDVRRVVVLGGRGGDDFGAEAIAAARAETPGWEWRVLGGSAGEWVTDPWASILGADVVVTHAGQNAVAEVAAARRPAVVVPQPRPHREQLTTGAVLAHPRWPAIVVDGFPTGGWSALLDRAAALPGADWSTWNDGLGARRAAELIGQVARGTTAARGEGDATVDENVTEGAVSA